MASSNEGFDELVGYLEESFRGIERGANTLDLNAGPEPDYLDFLNEIYDTAVDPELLDRAAMAMSNT